MGFQERVWRLWHGGGGVVGSAVLLLATPLEWLFRAVVGARNKAYDAGLLQTRRAAIPVVSVGNIAVGGAGKTPLCGWLVEQLRTEGAIPALLSRGYGSDELVLHRRWNPGVPVLSRPRRVEAARLAVEEGADVAILDDGFQHRALARDLDVVLMAAEHPLPVRLMPGGPYRESLTALARASHVVVTRRDASDARASEVEALARAAAPGGRVLRVDLEVDGWEDLDGEAAPAPEGDVLAVASVAGPGAFADLVRRSAGDVELWSFADHHAYTGEDADRIARRAAGRVITTTEKDAVKLVRYKDRLLDVRVLRLRVAPGEGADALRSAVLGLLGRP